MDAKYYFRPVFDDAEDKAAAAAAAAKAIADEAAAKDKAALDEINKNKGNFTQQQVNDLIAKEKGKIQKRYETRIASLEQIRDSKNLTQDEVKSLNTQIEEMQSEFKTKEQLAIEDAAKNKKDYETKLTKSEEASNTWQNRYTDMVIKNSIIGASVTNEAFDPDQIVALLRSNTRLTDKMDADGKKTGEFEPKTKFIGLDEESKEIELDISPTDVVKRMTQMDKYANLFKRAAVGGLGANNANRGVGVLGDLKNTNNYIAQRNKGKLETSKGTKNDK